MKVLVTGAPGWLGSRLVQELVRRDRDVRCLVLPGIDTGPLASLPVEIVPADIRNASAVDSAMAGIEAVFHCAGLIHPRAIRELYDVNVTGTENMLKAALAHRVGRFVYVSSNSAQGTNRGSALMEETQPCYPENAYGVSKFTAEGRVNGYHSAHGLPITIVRPPMLYGPGQPERMTRLMRMIKSGRPLVFGDGRNLRSMAYLDNLVEGMLLAEASSIAVGQTYWIADERPYTTLETLETIAAILGVQIRPRRLPEILAGSCELADKALSRLGIYSLEFHVVGESPKNIGCSIAKAKNELGYAPKVSLRQGMETAVEWCKAKGYL
jgi:nucleoside-diphosphate-sugar epimerase